MDAPIIFLVVALAVVGGMALWLFARGQRRPGAEAEARRQEQAAQRLEQQLASLQGELSRAVANAQQTMLDRVGGVDQRLDQRLEAVDTSIGRRLADMNQRLEAVDTRVNLSLSSGTEAADRINKQLGELGEAAKRIMEVGKDVTSLKDVLQPPKLRGAFGELLLEQLLKQVLPAAHYTTQHRFKDGTIVDVVITTPDGLVPVDSKFPIESYRRMFDATNDDDRARLRKQFIRDVRARVEEVAKYIRPDENTLDFACMYVPAEGIFYEIIAGGSEEDSMTFALERQVHLVSPNTFYALLQVVARGLARLQVQQDVKEFMARLSHVRREFARFRVEFDRLGNHLSHAKNKYDELDKWADKIDNRLAASADEPIQAPLPEPSIAPAPIGEPAQTNGHDEP